MIHGEKKPNNLVLYQVMLGCIGAVLIPPWFSDDPPAVMILGSVETRTAIERNV